MAPEIARRSGHSYSADIWSVGCVMIEMLTGNAPWSTVSRSVKEILQLIVSGQTPPTPSGISETCKNFIDQCLKEDFCQRPTAKELLKHEFLQDRNLDIEFNQITKTKFKEMFN